MSRISGGGNTSLVFSPSRGGISIVRKQKLRQKFKERLEAIVSVMPCFCSVCMHLLCMGLILALVAILVIIVSYVFKAAGVSLW